MSAAAGLSARRVSAMIAPTDAEKQSGMPRPRPTAGTAALRLAAVAALVATTLAITGCGRRGGLEFPPGSNPRENTVPANPDRPSGTRAPLEPFILDPLL